MNIKISNQENGTRVLALDRPPVNALADGLIRELIELAGVAMSDPEVLVLVITGAGKFFAAGADVDKLVNFDAGEAETTVSRVKELHWLLRKGPKPVIAALNGLAAGGGLELAMACDIRVAGKDVKVGLPEATLGVIPGAGGTQMLPRLVGLGKALELMFTGRLIGAEEAFQWGLLDHVTEPGQALAQSVELAGKIARNAPLALAEIKQAAYDTLRLPLEDGLLQETKAFGRVCETEDKNEGISAFKERRAAQFKGR